MCDRDKCISCGKEIDYYFGSPQDAVEFFSYGNYGSTKFDSVWGDEIAKILVCDTCFDTSWIQQNLTRNQ